MKKILFMLVSAMFLQIFSISVLADGLIIPAPNKGVNLISYDDFETDTLGRWEWWDSGSKNPSISLDDENGTNVLNMVEYNYYLPTGTYQNYTLEYNFKCGDYNSYPAIRFHRAGNKFAKLYIESSSVICVTGYDGGWIGSGEYDFSKLKDKWVYIKVELYDDTLKFYVNDKTTPVLTLQDDQLRKSGSIGFEGANKLDNIMLSRPKRAVPVPEYTPDTQELIGSFDGTCNGWASDMTPEVIDDDGETVYSVQGYDTFMNDAVSGLRNYNVEFNMKIDYSTGGDTPVFGNSWPGMYLRTDGAKRYNMYFETTPGAESICVEAVSERQREYVAHNADLDFMQEQDGWAYMKIEMARDIVNIYYMNKTTPAITLNKKDIDSKIVTPDLGGFTFVKGGASKFYIKNLIVTENIPSNDMANVPEIPQNQTMMQNSDFENGVNEFAQCTIETEGDNHVLALSGNPYTERTDFKNFTMEFNMKNDYKPFGTGFPAVHFRALNGTKYEIRLDTLRGKNQLVLRRGFSNLKTYPIWLIDNNNKWDYFKIEAYGANIKVYYNDKQTPIIDYTDSSPILSSGAVGFVTGINTKIDNLMIYSSDKPVIVNSGSFENNLMTLNITSYFETAKKTTLILAEFKEGKLQKVKTKEITLPKNILDGSALLPYNITEDFEASGDVKAYLVDENSNICMDVYPNTSVNNAKITVAPLNVSITLENSKLKINGDTGLNASVFMKLSKDGKILDLAQTRANSAGKINHEFTVFPDYEEGTYTLEACGEIGTTKVSKEFIYVFESNIDKFIENLNSFTGSEIFELFKTAGLYAQRLGMDINKYGKISNDNLKLALCSELKKSGTFTRDNIASVFNSLLTLPYIKDSSTVEIFKSRFEEDLDKLQIADDLYKTLSDELKTDICSGLLHNSSGYFTISDLISDLTVQGLLGLIYTSNYNEVKKIITENASVLGINISLISNIKSDPLKTEFYKGLNSKRCYSYFEFTTLYNAKIAAATSSAPTGGGGGGVGGSGGGGGNIVAPVIPTPEKDISFSDVSGSHWAYESITYLANKKIINGFSNNTFKPDDEITRSEFTKLFVTAFDLLNENAVCNFTDVDKNDWAYKYIASATEKNIITGSDNMFSPDSVITREDMATIIYRALNALKINLEIKGNTSFADINDVSSYAKEPVTFLANTGIINGTENGIFSPKGSATRAAASKIIYTILKGVK